MKKTVVKDKLPEGCGIPLLNMLNPYKLEREKAYNKHKLQKNGKKKA
jgi:hypothetical protein